jgi:hypothetical protein
MYEYIAVYTSIYRYDQALIIMFVYDHTQMYTIMMTIALGMNLPELFLRYIPASKTCWQALLVVLPKFSTVNLLCMCTILD